MRFRWGILGCGHIARSFTRGIQTLPGTDKKLAGGALLNLGIYPISFARIA
jgi:predicted dehydrogenase